MKISSQQVRNLLFAVAKTSNLEVSCQTCEDQLPQFADWQQTKKGIPSTLKLIAEHLDMCPECREELELINSALAAAV